MHCGRPAGPVAAMLASTAAALDGGPTTMIAEFQAIRTDVSQGISAALAGQVSAEAAPKAGESTTARTPKQAG